MSYAEFLSRKTARVEHPGREVALSDVHPMLHHWQAELVQWAVRTSRAALWADTGMVELCCGTGRLHLRNLRSALSNAACTPTSRPREILLESVWRHRQAHWVHTALCDVRHAVLSTPSRAGRGRKGQSVLHSSLLRRVEGGEHGRGHLPEIWAGSPASDSGRQSARQAIASRRSGPSHRSRQAQLRRVQLGGVSNPSGSRAVSRGWYVR